MPWLAPAAAAAAPYVALATTAAAGISQVEAGRGAAAQAKLAALEDDREANATQAIAQRQAEQERKKARYLRSRALAVAGASGAGVGDKGVSDILTDIDTEGDMNAMNILWSGDERARVLRSGAAQRRSEGEAAKGAGYLAGATTVLRGVGDFASNDPTFFKKYGRRGSTGFGSAGSRPRMRDFASADMGEVDN